MNRRNFLHMLGVGLAAASTKKYFDLAANTWKNDAFIRMAEGEMLARVRWVQEVHAALPGAVSVAEINQAINEALAIRAHQKEKLFRFYASPKWGMEILD